jgi:hypothetical protein
VVVVATTIRPEVATAAGAGARATGARAAGARVAAGCASVDLGAVAAAASDVRRPPDFLAGAVAWLVVEAIAVAGAAWVTAAAVCVVGAARVAIPGAAGVAALRVAGAGVVWAATAGAVWAALVVGAGVAANAALAAKETNKPAIGPEIFMMVVLSRDIGKALIVFALSVKPLCARFLSCIGQPAHKFDRFCRSITRRTWP